MQASTLKNRAAFEGDNIQDKKEHNYVGNNAYLDELLIWSERGGHSA